MRRLFKLLGLYFGVPEKKEMNLWGSYCSKHGVMVPCRGEHGSEERAIPFRMYPKAGESRFTGYELRDMYGGDFPLFREEVAPIWWRPRPIPAKLSTRYIRTNVARFNAGERLAGTDGRINAYGFVIAEDYHPEQPDITLKTLPVVCGCGGSAWLCQSCADRIMGGANLPRVARLCEIEILGLREK